MGVKAGAAMEKVLPTDLNTKYKCILSQEQSWADSLARLIKKARPITVWEVMIPILIIFNYARTKTALEIFARNFLFTKELALKAAREMMTSGLNKEKVLAAIEDQTRDLLATVKEGIYSEVIRRKQLKEIDLLIDHYVRLLQAEGRDYASLVINAYQSRKNYTAFLDQLKGAEREVNLSALETVGPKGDPEFVARIEQAADILRAASAEKIFPSSG